MSNPKLQIILDYNLPQIICTLYKRVPPNGGRIVKNMNDSCNWMSMDAEEGLSNLIRLGKWAEQEIKKLEAKEKC